MSRNPTRLLTALLLFGSVIILSAALGFYFTVRRWSAPPDPSPASTQVAGVRPAPAEPRSGPAEAPLPAPSVRVKAEPFALAAAREHVRALSQDIGVRAGGTTAELTALTYAQQCLEQWGYQTSWQGPIPMTPLPRESHNLIARHPGVAMARYRIVLGGHIDSIDNPKTGPSPGANDNGTGVAVILEVARQLAGEALPYGLEVVLFGAEESPDGDSDHHHYGSAYYVREQLMATPPVIGLINVDMIGVGPDFHAVTYDAPMAQAENTIERLVLASAERLGVDLRGGRNNSFSDHEAFARAGIPHVWLYRREDPDYHTPADHLANVEPEHLESCGKVVLQALLSLDPAWLRDIAAEAGAGPR